MAEKEARRKERAEDREVKAATKHMEHLKEITEEVLASMGLDLKRKKDFRYEPTCPAAKKGKPKDSPGHGILLPVRN